MKKVLFDTSVLVAASVQAHPMHQRALPWLDRARNPRDIALHVAAHSVAELYAVLTTLPLRPRISPPTAARLIHDNVQAVAKLVPLSASEYASVVTDLAERGLSGGIIYDALIARAAKKSGVAQLVTLNPDDFRRAWPDGSKIILEA
jgi:predicted nucleic acid-binding protein